MFKRAIQKTISQAIKQLFEIEVAPHAIDVDHPSLDTFGDYTSNIALKLVKDLPVKMPPLKIAEKIADHILQENKDMYESISAVNPGFINFTLNQKVLQEEIGKDLAIRLNEMIELRPSKERVLIEYIQPNTNKPLHIGHLRNAALGMSLLNIQQAAGNKVISANLNNDRGIHIIKSMYGYLVHGRTDGEINRAYNTLIEEWFTNRDRWHTPDTLKLKPDLFIGKYYILGNTDYEQSEKQAEESGTKNDPALPFNQMQQMLIDWEASEEKVRALWQQNNDWFYKGMHETLRKLGIKSPNDPSKFFDIEWYESEIYKAGKDIVISKIGNGIITECEDGHVEAILEKYNLPNIVLLRKNKTALYIIQDIEMLRQRLQEMKLDKVIYLTGNEQNLRFQQLFAIGESLDLGNLEQMVHFGYGMVRTPEGKMSSRKGNVISADELIEEVKNAAREKINQERADYSEQEKDEISNTVAIAAIKYAMLKYNPMSNMVFDLETSISFEGDTGPYLQYSHARTNSLLLKYNEKYTEATHSRENIVLEGDELSLLRHIYKYPEVVEKAALNYSPNHICEYLFNLAQKFNLFYTNNRLIGEENASKRESRLLTTRKTQEVLAHGLGLLGIQAPGKM